MRRANQFMAGRHQHFTVKQAKSKPGWKEACHRGTASTEKPKNRGQRNKADCASMAQSVRNGALARSAWLRRDDGCGTLRIEACGGRTHFGHCVHFFLWAGDRELPECLHPADSGRVIYRITGFAVPTVRNAHQVV